MSTAHATATGFSGGHADAGMNQAAVAQDARTVPRERPIVEATGVPA
ncbi:hypothetical protein [Burkholderia sp. A9]|nr:hypothetical protein [Burkholderia sp. A9]